MFHSQNLFLKFQFWSSIHMCPARIYTLYFLEIVSPVTLISTPCDNHERKTVKKQRIGLYREPFFGWMESYFTKLTSPALFGAFREFSPCQNLMCKFVHEKNIGNTSYLAILCALFGMAKWPFQRLLVTSNVWGSKGHLTLNHLVYFIGKIPYFKKTTGRFRNPIHWQKKSSYTLMPWNNFPTIGSLAILRWLVVSTFFKGIF